MSTMHDVYNPPPAPEPLAAPKADPVVWSSRDLAFLATLAGLVVALSAWAWTIDPTIAGLTVIGGAVVIVESWFTALGFLHRRPWMGLNGRYRIFVAALLPWIVGLGLAAGLMLGLFFLADRAG